MARRSTKIGPLTWVFIAIATLAFAAALAVIISLMTGRVALTNAQYYLVLIPLGLGAAGFLFGALRSQAKYSGQSSYGNLELRGPAVLFIIIVAGGLFANQSTAFPLTVRVHGPGGPSDVIREGTVTVYLDDVGRDGQIDARGAVTFPGVPSAFDGEPVSVVADVPGFVLPADTPFVIPESHVITLRLVPREYATPVRGSVRDSAGQAVPGATVSFDNGAHSAVSDDQGNFSVVLPVAPGSVVSLVVSNSGRIVFEENVTVSEQPPLRIVIGGR